MAKILVRNCWGNDYVSKGWLSGLHWEKIEETRSIGFIGLLGVVYCRNSIHFWGNYNSSSNIHFKVDYFWFYPLLYNLKLFALILGRHLRISNSWLLCGGNKLNVHCIFWDYFGSLVLWNWKIISKYKRHDWRLSK